MTTRRYMIAVIPVAHLAGANAFWSVYYNDAPGLSYFSQGANLDGLPGPDIYENPFSTATHFYCGMEVTEEWLSDMSNMAENMIQPAGGWPVGGVAESTAIAAAEEMYLQLTITQDGSTPDGGVTLTAALTALGLKKIIVEE